MSSYPQTAEAVAYAMLREIAQAEGVNLGADRKWLFDTYGECLKCTKAEPVKAGPTHGRSSF